MERLWAVRLSFFEMVCTWCVSLFLFFLVMMMVMFLMVFVGILKLSHEYFVVMEMVSWSNV